MISYYGETARIWPTHEQALQTIAQGEKLIKEKGFISISDWDEINGLVHSPNIYQNPEYMYKGWKSLDYAEVQPSGEGFVVRLPEPIMI